MDKTIINETENLTTEAKPRSFRLDDETNQAFKDLAAKIGGNQQQVMAKLIETYQGQYEKNELKNGAGLLETYEQYQSKMRDMFLTVLQTSEDATDLARTEFKVQLESKDLIIHELQLNLKEAKAATQDALDKLDPIKKELEDLKVSSGKEISILSDNIESLKDSKDKLEKELEYSKSEAREWREKENEARKLYDERVSGTAKLMDEVSELRKQVGPIKDNLSKVVSDNKILTSNNERLERENDTLRKDIDSLVESHQAELELAKQQGSVEMKSNMLDKLQEAQAKYNELNDKYLKLLEQTVEKKQK